MVMNKAPKTKSKAPARKAAATTKKTKLAVKETNGHNDSEEPQDSIETPSDEVSEEKTMTNGKPTVMKSTKASKPAPKAAATRKRKTSDEKEKKEEEEEEVEEPKPVAGPSKSKLDSTSKEASTSAVKRTLSIKTKAKKQKVVLDIPPVRSIAGKVFVMGENDVGQLGIEGVERKKRPAMLDLPYEFVDIAAGGMHSVCLTENGEVITFGCNDEGALGRITAEDDSLEFKPIKVSIPEKVVQISAGDSHSAALAESGHVYLWGNFRSKDGPMGLTVDHTKQLTPIRILSDVTVVKISSGTEHLACLSNDGLVYTLGCGENGQLGRIGMRNLNSGGRSGLASFLNPAQVYIGNRNVPIVDVWTGSYNTFLKAQTTGTIYAFGLNNFQQLGFPKQNEADNVVFAPKHVRAFSNNTWLRITGGQHHSLALDNNGLVYSLGRGEYGRLGLGDRTEELSVPTVIPTLQDKNSLEISCGNCVSFSITEEGTVFSWGMGDNHQLGHGSEDDCHIPEAIKGNFLDSWKALKVSGGGQHTLILAVPKENPKTDKKK
ncbi:hypothetical protein JTE90_025082 [Oedothorax gibbosus]|uniref:RCC1-like domain-containing protein n=1 Tax=Oedothorax gibbosus TaxID=931172 RepID=A0AAV6U818_9ARAC|nr:hypothetical protein JTE90_025082 [Oedothorax gibbosus]